ncbi:hypothetical protein Tco_0745691 [Tanacetum coccineum]
MPIIFRLLTLLTSMGEYKKVKAKLALLEDEEDVSSDDVIVQVKVLMALVEDKQLDVGKNHVRNGILLSMDEDAD